MKIFVQFVKGLRVELQRALAPLPPMGFVAAIEAATWTEMADQAVIQRKIAIGSAATPYKRLGQGPWTGNEGQPTLTPGGAHRVCTYCGRSGQMAEMCYQKSRLRYWCEKPGHVRDQCLEMQQVPLETSRRAGRPPVMRGAMKGRNISHK
ncbi:hypothetical protein M9H77_07127 [Catharanthus roseus]|uniref:Uncharacterized protein n=1 Tax=Catharanthus roseus TaxID=4058 RepID=A0ACC0BU16_CATRO|nr:hypothetical protein M9H77_07127 [Catharanthus roseus]